MKVCTEKFCQIVRLSLLGVSVCGWSVFLIGFGKTLSTIQKEKNSSLGDFTPAPSLVQGLTGPMWLFAVAGTLLYITYTLQVFKFSENFGHVLHAITVFFNFFFTAGGVLTLVVCALHQSEGFIGNILTTTLTDNMGMRMILAGTIVALKVFWIGLGMWPLLSITRTRYRGYTELQQSSS